MHCIEESYEVFGFIQGLLQNFLHVSFTGSNETLNPFSVVDVRAPQVFQAVRRMLQSMII